jgi:hypothetical protein
VPPNTPQRASEIVSDLLFNLRTMAQTEHRPGCVTLLSFRHALSHSPLNLQPWEISVLISCVPMESNAAVQYEHVGGFVQKTLLDMWAYQRATMLGHSGPAEGTQKGLKTLLHEAIIQVCCHQPSCLNGSHRQSDHPIGPCAATAEHAATPFSSHVVGNLTNRDVWHAADDM